MSTGVAEGAAELRLIPEFAGTGGSIVEWLEKAELVCSLQSITSTSLVGTIRFCAVQILGITKCYTSYKCSVDCVVCRLPVYLHPVTDAAGNAIAHAGLSLYSDAGNCASVFCHRVFGAADT